MKYKGTHNENESIVSSRLLLDMDAISAMGNMQEVPQETMDATGLNAEAIEGLLEARYSKVVHKRTNGSRYIYEYSAYEDSVSISIYIRLGDGYDMLDAYSLYKDKARNKWYVTVNAI